MRPTLVIAAAVLALSACSSGGADTDGPSTPVVTGSTGTTTASTTSAATTSAATTAGPLAVERAWSKAASSGMSAAFATVRNTTDRPVVVEKASSPVSGMTQLHVTTKDANGAMVMAEAKNGFTIPAHGTLELTPGGSHIMFMHLTKPLLAGDSVPVTLTVKDAAPVTFTAQVRAYSGAKETYAPGSTGTATHDMAGMGASTATHSAAATSHGSAATGDTGDTAASASTHEGH